MRLVLDTDVLVAALRSDRGASRRLLEAALDGQYALLLSVPLAIQYEAVLTRQEHLDAAGVSRADVAILLEAVIAVAEPVRLSFLWRPLVSDPEDDMVAETAVNGTAELLVTFNRKDFARAGERFHLTIVSPGEALGELRRKS
jgi:putative PIN family toxin of toxin-antitoxin system